MTRFAHRRQAKFEIFDCDGSRSEQELVLEQIDLTKRSCDVIQNGPYRSSYVGGPALGRTTGSAARDDGARHAMNKPPFTSSATPLMYDASSLARNAIAAACSSGVEIRLIGMKY